MGADSFPISFVKATKEDAAYIDDLTRRAMIGYVSQTWSSPEEIEKYFVKNAYEPSVPTWLLLNGSQTVGRLSMKESRTSSGTNIIILDNIHIEPAYQGKGIGSLAIDSLIFKQAREKKVPVCLMVLKNNPAESLYKRLGFRVIGGSDTRLYMGWSTPAGFTWDGDT
jgi:predicted N-acetyltransferase YhbS